MMFRRKPIRWPNNARIAITTCVVTESWPDNLGTGKSLQSEFRKGLPSNAKFKRDICSITDRQYGERVGVYRVMEILRQEGIKASFFVNGHTVETFPDMMKLIVAEGHELCSENWRHEYAYMMTQKEQRDDIKRTVNAFQKVLGFKPQGFIMPGERPTDDTPKILIDLGYKYWMCFLHEDLPYVLKVGRGELVLTSYGVWMTDHRTGRADAGRTPRELLQIWKDHFDWIYEEGGDYPGFMSLGLHPFLIGRPFRAIILREFYRYAKGHAGVWFPRGIDLANYWLENCHDNLVEKWPNYGTGLAYEKTQVKQG
ncbi:MAG: polysaccharide deacetylase family protein [Deltaproteobacteria bacterium]|nr:polysaccharide deacetylase family protein [Deltaproteobacteria bacterium]